MSLRSKQIYPEFPEATYSDYSQKGILIMQSIKEVKRLSFYLPTVGNRYVFQYETPTFNVAVKDADEGTISVSLKAHGRKPEDIRVVELSKQMTPGPGGRGYWGDKMCIARFDANANQVFDPSQGPNRSFEPGSEQWNRAVNIVNGLASIGFTQIVLANLALEF